MQNLLSDNWSTVAKALKDVITKHRASQENQYMAVAQRYYNHDHDINKNRIFYLNNMDQLVEDKYASNVKISHSFFSEQVDQKVQYLLSNPVEVEVEDEDLKVYLEEYWNEDMQLFLNELVEDASINGKNYAYAVTTQEDMLKFQVASAMNTILIRDSYNQVVRVLYYTDEKVIEGNETKTITSVQLFTDKQVIYFKSTKKGYELDTSLEHNPRAHVIAHSDKGELLERNYGVIPFYELANNKHKTSDLKPIKELIDDYDIMACYLSNDLKDFSEAIYVVTGYDGEDVDRLRNNIKTRKVVNAGSGDEAGDVKVRTVNIPVEARNTKLVIDKECIYKFGMAFDSSQVGDGNITNVVIQSRYALLDMKANKMEVRLRALLKWLNEMIVSDINRRHRTAFKATDIKVSIVRESVTDAKENADIQLIEAQVKESAVQTILAVASYLDRATTLRQICEQFDLVYEDVIELIDGEEYTPLSTEVDVEE